MSPSMKRGVRTNASLRLLPSSSKRQMQGSPHLWPLFWFSKCCPWKTPEQAARIPAEAASNAFSLLLFFPRCFHHLANKNSLVGFPKEKLEKKLRVKLMSTHRKSKGKVKRGAKHRRDGRPAAPQRTELLAAGHPDGARDGGEAETGGDFGPRPPDKGAHSQVRKTCVC